jgi:uncharacterized protein
MEMSPHLEELARRHGIELILQFGSSVKGTEHERSDLDLAVRLASMPELDRELDLRAELQKIFPDREVDVAILNRADPLFLKQIVERCRLLYGTERELAELQILAFKRYQDHRRYLALEEDYVRRSLEAAHS